MATIFVSDKTIMIYQPNKYLDMQSDTQQICFLVIKDQANLSIKCATSHQKDIDQIKSDQIKIKRSKTLIEIESAKRLGQQLVIADFTT